MSEEPVYRVHEADDGRFYWTLVASNGETLSTSQMYASRQGADRGVAAAKRAAARAD